MEFLVVNSIGKYKEVTLNSRKYLSVPSRIIVPGVMAGSKGPLLYTEVQNKESCKEWNGIPLVAPTHPTINNKPVSAKLPSIRLKYGIGYATNASVSKNGCLDVDNLFDILLCNRIDKRIIPWIREDSPIELSTGLGSNTKIELVENGKYKGISYIGEVKRYEPDHIAILCDDVGACSVAMGCGVGVRNKSYSRGVLITNNNNKEDSSMDKKGIWAKLGELVGITCSVEITNEASYMDLVEALSQQLRYMYQEMHKNDYPDMMSYQMPSLPYIVDVFSDSVIYSYCQSMWKLGYSTASNDTITLSQEDPIEVQRITSYQEVSDSVLNSGKKLTDITSEDLWEPIANLGTNEHAARVFNPDEFLKNTFRRKQLGKGISAIMGKKTAGGPMMVQSYRFDAKKFSPEEAKKWMMDHHNKMVSFIPATNLDTNNSQNIGNATKKEGSNTLSAKDYAYVPDPSKPSTWKLRIDDASHVGGAIAAIGKGFRGNKVSIPSSAMAGVKAKIRAAWKKFHPDKAVSEMPDTIRNELSQEIDIYLENDESIEVINSGDNPMPLTPEVRKTMVDGLVANCNCNHNVPWKGSDANTLNSLSDDTIQAYDTWNKSLNNTPVAPPITNQQNNNQPAFFKDAQGNDYLMNPITNQLVRVNGTNIQNTNTQNSGVQGTGQNTQSTQVNNNQSNQNTNPTNVQDWLNKTFQNAPPEAAEIFNSMQEDALRQKAAHIERLIGSLEGDAKTQATAIYNAMNLKQLQVLVQALPQQTQQKAPIVNWLGNAPTPIGGSTINEKPLESPKLDFKDIRNKRRHQTNSTK